jgi:hypothetical protein
MFANAMAQVVQSLVQVGGTTCSISSGAKLALKATRTRAVEASAFLTVALRARREAVGGYVPELWHLVDG